MSFTPEIVKGDPLYELIVSEIVEKKPKKLVEIGSANGLGSTQAFIEGVLEVGDVENVDLFCIEAHPERFNELMTNLQEHREFAHPVRGCSVDIDGYVTEEYIEEFMRTAGYQYNIVRYHSVDTVKKWREEELQMIGAEETPQNVFAYLEKMHGVTADDIDMVLIDGSAFTGLADLAKVLGAKTIIMDDTMDIKCRDAMDVLLVAPMYRCVTKDDKHRNGYAVFERIA